MGEASTARPRPTVWVNCAASMDGRIAFARGARARLSSPEDLRRVQSLRAELDAVLVGVGTVVLDDPSLRVHWELLGRAPGREPTRVIVDGSGRTPATARALDGSVPTIVVTTARNPRLYPASVRRVTAGDARVDLGTAFEELGALGIRSILVEGGAEILGSVLRSGAFDRLTVYYAPWVFGSATAPPIATGPAATSFEDARPLELEALERAGVGYVASYRPVRSGPARAGSPRPPEP